MSREDVLGDEASAGGVALVRLRGEAQRARYVERIVLICEDLAVGVEPPATVYAGSAARTNLRDYTPDGSTAIAEYPRPMLIPAGRDLVIRWTGATAGAQCTAIVQSFFEAVRR